MAAAQEQPTAAVQEQPTAAAPARPTILRTGGRWREDVWDRILRLYDAATIPSDRTPPAGVLEHVDRAAQAANASKWAYRWDFASQIEACWRELRLAETAILRSSSGDELRATAFHAHRRGELNLGASDPEVVELGALLAVDPAGRDLAHEIRLRSCALAVLSRSHQASDQHVRNLRSLRTQLRTLGALLAVLAVGFVLAVRQLHWQVLPTPGATGAGSAGSAPMSDWGTVCLAMVAGMLGALFSAIPSLSQVPEQSVAFNPLREQAVLKLAVGAWSAVFGLMAVTAGLGEPDSSTSSIAGFTMVAALFGAGQEALTRFADRKASVLRDAPVAPAGLQGKK